MGVRTDKASAVEVVGEAKTAIEAAPSFGGPRSMQPD
jgi:hypothetical protein